MKYSLAIALLLNSVSAEEIAVENVQPEELRRGGGSSGSGSSISTRRYVRVSDSFNADMDAALKKAEGDIPARVVIGGGSLKVDQAAMKDMMEADRKFWQQDARKLEDLVGTVLVEPLQRTQVRIAASIS
jgi:hypothetical protein